MKRRKILAAGFAAFLSASAICSAVEYEGAGYRDPFARQMPETAEERAARASQKASSFSLDGIAYGTRFQQAIINGQVVEIGQNVGTAIVKTINKNSVILTQNGKEYVLKEKGNG